MKTKPNYLKAKKGSPKAWSQVWQPFEGFRREIDRLFEDFGRSFCAAICRSFFAAPPLWGREKTWSTAPAVDVVEKARMFTNSKPKCLEWMRKISR